MFLAHWPQDISGTGPLKDTDSKNISKLDLDDSSTVFVVDLDGTLCRTDTLHEALLALATKHPATLLGAARRLPAGKAAFKEHVADALVIPGDGLPLNECVLEQVRAAKAAGRKTAMVTASDQRQANAVAEATGLFDEVFGSADGRNLSGAQKARFLTERYGPKGFDYVGDARADLPVWKNARQAFTVAASGRLSRAADAVNSNSTHLAAATPKRRAMLQALRPHQWSKNALLFLPMLAAHDFSALGQVLIGFLAFCLTASAAYVINDLADLAADRAHPRKRHRPFAAGELSAVTGVAMAIVLLSGAVALALATGSLAFLGTLFLYLTATFVYSLWLKRKLIVDVIMLAALYTVRIIAGGAVAEVFLSPWMLGFSMFIFLALAAVKRQAELVDLAQSGRSSVGRAYQVDDLPILRGMALSAGNAAIMVLALYINSSDVQRLYAQPWLLWLICPLLLYWLMRMVMMTHRGHMSDDPIVFAATDNTSKLVVVLSALVVVLATVV